jgi:DnaD/phage-associated family protein
MRLHNRQIKASFWNDPDLLRWPRDKRWFYEGLSQLADDSGCLEDDPFAFKINLFPSPIDADITEEVLAKWVEELIQDKKLIRYVVGRKQCLFMVNFHKHQSLKNPAAPDVPLPPFLKWETYKSNKDAGKYVIDERLLSSFLDDSEDILRTFFQPEPEPEININNADDNVHAREKEPDQTVEPDTLNLNETVIQEIGIGAKAIQFAEKAWGRPVAPLDCENIAQWCKDFSLRGSPEPDEIVIEALRRSSEQGVRKMKYVSSILCDWYDSGVLQASQILEQDRKFKQTKKSRAGPGKKKTGTDSGKYDSVYL